MAESAPAVADGETIAISFTSILRQMPQELHGKNSPGSSAKFAIAVDRVVEQLPYGAVRVPFKELRRSAPVGIFVSHHGHDEKLIDLPLKDIVPQLRPENLTRRRQVRLEAPDDGTELFNRAGKPTGGLRVLGKDELLKGEPAPEKAPEPARAPEKVALVTPTQPSGPIAFPAAQAAVRKPAQPQPQPQPVAIPLAPSAPIASPDNVIAIPLQQLAQQWPNAVREKIEAWGRSDLACFVPMATLGAALKSGAVRFAWQDISSWINPAPPQDNTIAADTILDLPLKLIAPLYMAKCRGGTQQKKVDKLEQIPDVFSKQGLAAVAAAAAAEAPDEDEIAPSAPEESDPRSILPVSLSLLSQKWPDALRKEIALLRLTDAKVELPIETLEAALKVGKFECYWKQICHWLKPCPTAALASVHADVRLDMPLNLLAPLYLKQRPPAEGAAEGARNAAGAQSAGAETPQVETKQARSLAELFDEPDKRNWTPNEIVHKTSQLPAVAGALMALQDGLLVASCMPPDWKSETIAAFLPQIFGRMKQYSKELKMGELESISLSVEQGTFQIFNVGIIYFAVLAKPAALPSKESLKLIVRELARHTR